MEKKNSFFCKYQPVVRKLRNLYYLHRWLDTFRHGHAQPVQKTARKVVTPGDGVHAIEQLHRVVDVEVKQRGELPVVRHRPGNALARHQATLRNAGIHGAWLTDLHRAVLEVVQDFHLPDLVRNAVHLGQGFLEEAVEAKDLPVVR